MDSKILLVDDNPSMIQVMAQILGDVGQLRFATSGEDGLKKIHESVPDLILLDAQMPGMSGFDVCEAMKIDRNLRNIPIIFVTSLDEVDFEVSGLNAGAVDYLAKPVNPALLVARVKAQLRAKHQADILRNLVRVDAVTDAANSRWFNESLQREWQRGLRTGQPISVLCCDIDHFKEFNERYGDSVGDDCLRQIANTLRGACRRPPDLLGRLEGDVFVLLLPDTSLVSAQHLAHCMLEAVESLRVAHATSAICGHVTLSIGVASFDADNSFWIEPSAQRAGRQVLVSATDLLRSARQALSLAQNNGGARAWSQNVSQIDKATQGLEVLPEYRASIFAPH